MQRVLLSNIRFSVPKLQTPLLKKIILQDVIIIVINIVITLKIYKNEKM